MTVNIYKERWEPVGYAEGGRPYCPLCKRVMWISSSRRGETTWECHNRDRGEGGLLVCPFIEGRLDRRANILWDCKYEARAE